MTHFAVLCPEVSGHLNPMTSLLKELRNRGHRVTWLGTLDGVELVRARGMESRVFGKDRFPLGTMDQQLAEIGKLSGLRAARFTLEHYRRAIDVILQEVPGLVAETGANALIVDESIFCGRTIAEIAQIPWITVCNALPFHPDPAHPPIWPAWSYRPGVFGRLRNQLGMVSAKFLLGPIAKLICNARQQHGLPDYDLANENASSLATLAQLPKQFDYPRSRPLPWFHYVGGLQDLTSRPVVDFPYDRLDGRPLIYASLGTIQNRVLPVFRRIAEACQSVTAQLVVSLGGGANPEDMGRLPGDPVVVPFAPQLELIQRARVVITHAGMNTTMESIAEGVPMVALPITNDQPAVARRIEWSGCGLRIPIQRATVGRIRQAVERVLHDPQFSNRAAEMALANRAAGGRVAAADLIDGVVG